MTRLSYVDIENFRGISSLRYEPRQVNVLIGRNNSGKTTILEAIYANLRGNGSGTNQEEERRLNVKIGSSSATITSDTHTFVIYSSEVGMPTSLLIQIQSQFDYFYHKICTEMDLPPVIAEKIFKIFYDDFPKIVSTYDGKLQYPKDIDLRPPAKSDVIKKLTDSLSDEEIKEINTAVYGEEKREYYTLRENTAVHSGYSSGKTSTDNQINRSILKKFYTAMLIEISVLIEEQTEQTFSNEIVFLRPSTVDEFDFGDSVRLLELEKIIKEYNIIPNLERLNNNEVVYKSENDSYYALPYEMHGDGFVALLDILSTMYDVKGGVLLLEEPENHMHPGYLNVFVEQLMTLAKELDVQVFLTTHSYDLIDEFARYPMNEEEEAMIQITNVVRRNGEHELYNHSPSEALRTMDEMKIDLRGT